MLLGILLACAPGVNGEGGEAMTTSLDIDMAPREFFSTFTTLEFNCASNDDFSLEHLEYLDAVTVTNYEADPVTVSVHNEWPDDGQSWIAPGFHVESTSELDSTRSTSFDLIARGNCADGVVIPAGEHGFDLAVFINDVAYDIAVTITVQ